MIEQSFDFIRVFSAAGLAFLAMSALIAGTLTGIFIRPSQRTNAIIMAFGTGALIQALSIDLAYHGANRLIEHMKYTGFSAWLVVSTGFFIGGFLYYLVNKVLEKRGAAIRHPAMAKFYFLRKKRDEKLIVLEQLSNVELLRSLPPEDIEMVLDAVKPISVPANNYIFRKGDAADGLYLITDGHVQILDQQEDNVLAILSAGESFGEMALLTGEPRYASARTGSPVSLLKIDKSQFSSLLKVSPYLKQSIEQLNSKRLMKNVEAVQVDKDHWMKIAMANIERLSKSEEYAYLSKVPKGAPLAIFLGAMMDLIPESIVIGASFSDFSSYRYTFLAAVFLANFPEAMASSNAMM
jgi:CRP-like cAMP-binding protein